MRVCVRVITIALCVIMFFVACAEKHDKSVVDKDKSAADSLAEKMWDAYDACDFSTTVDVGQQALNKYEMLKDTASMCDVMSALSLAQLRLGNVAEGFRIVERTIRLDSIKGDPELLSNDYNSMAGMYLSVGNGSAAEPFILKAIECEQQTTEKSNLSNRYGIASEVYCKIEQPHKAVDYALKGLECARERNDTAQIGTRLSQLGQAYIASHMLDKAESTLKDCAVILESIHKELSLGITYRQLGSIYREQHNTVLAIDYYEKAMALARKTNYSMLLCQCTQDLGEILADSQPSRALTLLIESRALSDTLHSQKVEELMADIAIRYALGEKQQLIDDQATQLNIHRIVLVVIILTIIAIIAVISLFIITKRLRRRNERLEACYSERIVAQTQHQEPEMNCSDKDFIEKLATYVEEHIADTNLSSTTMAEAFFLSPRQFSRRVKQLTGIDTTHYVRASRILRARNLLSTTDMTMQEICTLCGFDTPNYFSRIFRENVGMSPTEYRKESHP